MGLIHPVNNLEASEAKLGRRCPYCDTDFVSKVLPDPVIKKGEVWRKAQCPKCGGKWFIVYEFKKITGLQW